MKSSHFINDKKFYFTDIGQGPAIVLLHGYLESMEIGGEFAIKLSKKNSGHFV